MATQTMTNRKEQVASRSLARSAAYQLLSQALTYPSEDAIASLRDEDLPRATEAAAWLPEPLHARIEVLGDALKLTDAVQLQAHHRHVFSHILSLDCPPNETVYTASQVFQETQELSDIVGFLRAFGLELAERERPDHISVELEFMQFLTFKEAYALLNHGSAKARICRQTQRKFMQGHLGRWVFQFTQRLTQKAGVGFYVAVAGLADAFVSCEIDLLRARPEAVVVDPDWRTTSAGDAGCAATEDCPLVEAGRDG